jgi:cytoskeleton protein RodZ
MTSLGQELKKEREARNISLDEMASSTKIVGRYLVALEEDRLDTMPGGFFVKGIIRSYARYLGLDENAILEKYREAGFLEEPPASQFKEESPEAAPGGQSRAALWVVVAAAIVVLIVALIFLLKPRRPSPGAAPTQAARALSQARPSTSPAAQKLEAVPPDKPASENASQPASEPAAKPPSAPVSEPSQTEWKGLTMDITFQEETWLQIYADGNFKLGGLFPAGQTARVQAAKEILLYVGNAGGMTFLLNGSPAKILGRTGEVRNNVLINLENYKDFLQPREPSGPSD